MIGFKNILKKLHLKIKAPTVNFYKQKVVFLANIVCSKCNNFHNTVMHIESNGTHGGEYVNTEMPRRELNSSVKCTQICGRKGFTGKSCAKKVIANVYRKGNEENMIRTYAIIDDKSNRFLARPDLMNTFENVL